MIENAEFRAEASKHFKALAKRYLRTNGHMCRKVQTALEAIWDMNEIAPLIYDAEGNRLISNDHLRELVEADAEGRISIRPVCKECRYENQPAIRPPCGFCSGKAYFIENYSDKYFEPKPEVARALEHINNGRDE